MLREQLNAEHQRKTKNKLTVKHYIINEKPGEPDLSYALDNPRRSFAHKSAAINEYLPWSLSPEPIENDAEIDRDLESLQRERAELEAQLNSEETSICDAESNFVNKIRRQLWENFEEEWDITHSISEINELQKANNEQILIVANDMEQLIEAKELAQSEQERMAIGEQLNFKLNEIEALEKAMEENTLVLQEWMDAKKVNEEQKRKIQDMLTNVQSSKRKDLIELQISMRKLKLEKTDLHLKNLQIK